MKEIPLYIGSFKDAKRNNELDLYRESFAANCYCKADIENAIRNNFDGMHLKANCIKDVVSEWGFDRTIFVLANTIQQHDYDGRFSRDNEAWAKTVFIPEDSRNRDFIVYSHPAVLDGFVDSVRKTYRDLNLWDKTHCTPPDNLNFENKVMVLKPEILKDEYKTPDYQLFYCESGFGCSPSARGRKVFGQFLIDGERANYDRQDFIGELKPGLLPEWATDKVKNLQKPSIKKQLADMPKQKPEPKKEMKDKGAR